MCRTGGLRLPAIHRVPVVHSSPVGRSPFGIFRFRGTDAMSTFYLLPPRSFLGECLASSLKPLFPGLPWTEGACTELAEALATAVARHPDVYVVYREELPEGEETARALADGFG